MNDKVAYRKGSGSICCSHNFFARATANFPIKRTNIDMFRKWGVKRVRLESKFINHSGGSRHRRKIMKIQVSRKGTDLQQVEPTLPDQRQRCLNGLLVKRACGKTY